jgi:hypothetical protein
MYRPTLALALPDYFYFVFAVCVLISACIVLFYAKRHPNPHFRPRKSDVGIVSFVLLFLSGGIAFMTSGALDTKFDPKKMEKKMDEDRRMAKMNGTSVEEEAGLVPVEPGKAKTDDAVDLPDNVPDEVRELINGS